ncbi:MAG: hypothetical protein R2850_11785 [Bacteroidia bacterium]
MTLFSIPRTTANVTNVQKLIASAVDTRLFTGDDQAYSGLHECCQYEKINAKANTV